MEKPGSARCCAVSTSTHPALCTHAAQPRLFPPAPTRRGSARGPLPTPPTLDARRDGRRRFFYLPCPRALAGLQPAAAATLAADASAAFVVPLLGAAAADAFAHRETNDARLEARHAGRR